MKHKQFRKNNIDTTTNSTGRITEIRQQTVEVEQQRYNNKQYR
jgi:hypothetical protein